MILVDTSAWVEHLRATGSDVGKRLDRLIDEGAELVTTEAVVMELLAGADTSARELALEQLTSGLPVLSIDPALDFRRAAQIYQRARLGRERNGGRTVRSLLDCLIASVALRYDVSVLHRDADFDAIAAVTGLRVQGAG